MGNEGYNFYVLTETIQLFFICRAGDQIFFGLFFR